MYITGVAQTLETPSFLQSEKVVESVSWLVLREIKEMSYRKTWTVSKQNLER